MTVEWHDPKNKLPEDGEECLLMPIDNGSIITLQVYGPIAWHANSGTWMDLFATPEAGEVVKPEVVGRWTLWEPIAPREDEDANP